MCVCVCVRSRYCGQASLIRSGCFIFNSFPSLHFPFIFSKMERWRLRNGGGGFRRRVGVTVKFLIFFIHFVVPFFYTTPSLKFFHLFPYSPLSLSLCFSLFFSHSFLSLLFLLLYIRHSPEELITCSEEAES